MADRFKKGSKAHKMLLGSWLATTLVFLSLASSTAFSSASSNSSVPEHVSILKSVGYAGTYYSLSDYRITESKDRDCAKSSTCADVIVAEVLISNTNSSVWVTTPADYTLAYRTGARFEPVRFDCANKVESDEVSQKGIDYGCPSKDQVLQIGPGETKAVSLVFFAVVATPTRGTNLDLEIKEAHRAKALPAVLPLGQNLDEEVVFPAVADIEGSTTHSLPEVAGQSQSLEIESAKLIADVGATRVAYDERYLLVTVRFTGELPELQSSKFWQLDDRVRLISPTSLTPVDGGLEMLFTVRPDFRDFTLLGNHGIDQRIVFANTP